MQHVITLHYKLMHQIKQEEKKNLFCSLELQLKVTAILLNKLSVIQKMVRKKNEKKY